MRLREFAIFASVSDKDLALAESFMERLTFSPRKRMFEQGDRLDGIYVVFDGFAKISHRQLSGNDTLLELSGKGSVLGLDNLAEDSPQINHAQALTELSVGFLRRSEVLDLMKRHDGVMKSIVSCLGSKCRGYQVEVLKKKGNISPEVRLAEVFLKMPDACSILDKKEVAQVAGIDLRSFRKVIQKWHSQHFVQDSLQDVKILQPDALKELVVSGWL